MFTASSLTVGDKGLGVVEEVIEQGSLGAQDRIGEAALILGCFIPNPLHASVFACIPKMKNCG